MPLPPELQGIPVHLPPELRGVRTNMVMIDEANHFDSTSVTLTQVDPGTPGCIIIDSLSWTMEHVTERVKKPKSRTKKLPRPKKPKRFRPRTRFARINEDK